MVGIDQIIAHLYPFWLVAETGSFTKAGEYLGLTQSAVSYQVKALESKLDKPLLVRLPRNRFKLSNEGEILAKSLKTVFGQMKMMLERLDNPKIGGLLRVAAPVVFGSSILTPFIAQLNNEYPDLDVELHLTDGIIDFFGANVDLGFCFGLKKERYQGGIKCFSSRIVLVTSEKYLKTAPPIDAITDLKNHSVVINPDWRLFEQLPLNPMAIKPRRWRMFNNTYAMIEALRHGMGVSFLPAYAVDREIQKGELVEILSDQTQGFEIETFAVAPDGSLQSSNTSAFLEGFLKFSRAYFPNSFLYETKA